MSQIIKVENAAVATITCALATTPLASSATFVLGRQSTKVDNTSFKYVDALVSGKVTVGTSPVADTQIRIYVYGLDEVPNYPDVLTGTDADLTLTSAGIRDGLLRLGAVLSVDSNTNNRTYPIVPFAVAPLFGNNMPSYWGLFVTHNTGVALHATGSNHAFRYQGINYSIN